VHSETLQVFFQAPQKPKQHLRCSVCDAGCGHGINASGGVSGCFGGIESCDGFFSRFGGGLGGLRSLGIDRSIRGEFGFV
jgi:hypothetical protein